VYLEFCSKEAIVAELGREHRGKVIVAMERALGRGSYSAQLERALEARVRTLFAMAGQGAHSCDLVACRPAATGGQAFSDGELAVLTKVITAGTQAGEFACSDSAAAVAAIAEAFSALSPPRIFERNERECVLACRSLSNLLTSGLREPKAPSRRASAR
jgi:hypothetical protein